ncbi:hypothetical protein ACFL3H_00405 [Gemmatimonadota bacterium]
MTARHTERLPVTGLILSLALLVGCGTAGNPATRTLTATLQFQMGIEGGARDFTFDADGNMYLFDYMHYMIRKLTPDGQQLIAFGGNVEEGGLFTHLMEIEIFNDRLVALDSVALFTFDLDGNFLDQEDFAEEVICERPAVARNGEFIGERFIDAEARSTLTQRRADGTEQARLESYALSDFIPAIVPGVDFFLSMNHMRSYRYAYLPDGSPIWASTDAFLVNTMRGEEVRELITGDYSPVSVPDDQVEQMKSRSESLPPPLFMYVPDSWRLIHQLFAGSDGDIWVYLQSLERTGFLHCSSRGRERAFYTFSGDLDPGDEDVMIREYEGRLWFLVPGRDEVTVYTAAIPG